MKAPKGYVAVLVVMLAWGCLQKPAPSQPGEIGTDGCGPGDEACWARTDAETVTGDGHLGDLDLRVQDGSEGLSPPDADAEAQPCDSCAQDQQDGDGDLPPEDCCAPEETVDGEVFVPGEGGGAVVPGVFSGWSAGGKYTLYPVGAGGVTNGMAMIGGKWTLSLRRSNE